MNGTEIPEDLIAAEAQNHPARSPAEARAMAAHALVIRHLLLSRAADMRLAPDPETDPAGRRECTAHSFDLECTNLKAPLVEPDGLVGHKQVTRLLIIKGDEFNTAVKVGEQGVDDPRNGVVRDEHAVGRSDSNCALRHPVCGRNLYRAELDVIRLQI